MTDGDIIAALGGPTKLARKLNAITGVSVSSGRVSNWPLRGIPAEFRPAIAGMLPGIGKKVPDGFLLGVAAGAKIPLKNEHSVNGGGQFAATHLPLPKETPA